ncbi:MAG: NINE protein [Turicibacter sp.]
MYCKSCGQQLQSDEAVMCLNCGVKKGNGSDYCASCGAPKKSQDADYCVSCGCSLKSSMFGSVKTKGIALILWFFLGLFGAHQFYVCNNKYGFFYLALTLLGFVTCGVTTLIASVWAIVDLIYILTDKFKDENGNPLVEWWV